MGRRIGSGGTLGSLLVPGIYARIKTYELAVSLRPDPRLVIGDVPAAERAALASQPDAPTALGQVESLRCNLPVTVPRWYLGGRSYPEVNGWPPYDNRRIGWFIVTPDDTIAPGGEGDGGFPSERALKQSARRAGYRTR